MGVAMETRDAECVRPRRVCHRNGFGRVARRHPPWRSAAERYVVIVSGAAGECPNWRSSTRPGARALVTSLQDKTQMPPERLIVLIDKVDAHRRGGRRRAPRRSRQCPASPPRPDCPLAVVRAVERLFIPGGAPWRRPRLPRPWPAGADPAQTAEIDKRAISATRDNVRATLTKLAQDTEARRRRADRAVRSLDVRWRGRQVQPGRAPTSKRPNGSGS